MAQSTAEPYYLFGPETEATEARERQELVDDLRRILDSGLHLASFAGNFRLALRDRIWEFPRRLAGGGTVEPISFHAFIHKRYPVGIGADDKTIMRLIADDALAVKEYRELVTAAQGTNQHTLRPEDEVNDNVMHKKAEQGSSRAYTLSRLSKQEPHLFDAVSRGEMSANAAAIEAGWRKKLTPFEQVARLIPKLTSEERNQIVELMSR